MVILTVGLSHKTAPVEIRERLHIPEGKLPAFLELLGKEPSILERLVLSTCNRVEVYAVTHDPVGAQAAISQLLAEGTRTPLSLFEESLYVHLQEAAIRHTFRVASSLDSMVLGESQILNQVKAAFQVAFELEATGPILNTLMERSLGVAKKVRTETGIAESPVSVPSAAIGLSKKIFGDLAGRTVLILGAGEMSELAARHLISEGVYSVLVSNRNFDRAVELAERLRGRAVRFDQVRQEMLRADVVISSTAAPHYVLHRADMEELIRLRRNRPIFLIDIAVPRDIEPEVNQIDNVYLYDIDDLQGVVEANRKERQRETGQAEVIIDREMRNFIRWLKSLEVVPTIVTLRRRLEEIRETELEKALARLPDLPPAQQEVVRALAHGIVNTILHHPTTELKRQSISRDRHLYVNALRRLFGLQDEG
ncbi:MAG: glutamyl-tRNA reductase [Candidatus Methylomirabilales bacterium]